MENHLRQETTAGRNSRPHEEWSDRLEDGLEERKSEAAGYRCEGSGRSERYDQIGNALSTHFLRTTVEADRVKHGRLILTRRFAHPRPSLLDKFSDVAEEIRPVYIAFQIRSDALRHARTAAYG